MWEAQNIILRYKLLQVSFFYWKPGRNENLMTDDFIVTGFSVSLSQSCFILLKLRLGFCHDNFTIRSLEKKVFGQLPQKSGEKIILKKSSLIKKSHALNSAVHSARKINSVILDPILFKEAPRLLFQVLG